MTWMIRITGYCFICAEELSDKENAAGHYLPGGCPRFGNRDNFDAIWDEVVVPDRISQWEFDPIRFDLANYDANGDEHFSYASVNEHRQAAAERLNREAFDPVNIQIEHSDDHEEGAGSKNGCHG